jgi:biotin transport system substrate-specific component
VTFTGPTAGYLYAFIPAAWLVAHFIERCDHFGSRLALFIGSSALILVSGTLWLALLLNLGILEAMIMGFFPFLVGDLVKSAAAASLIRRMGDSEPAA